MRARRSTAEYPREVFVDSSGFFALADRFLAQVRQSPPSSHVRVTEQDEEDALTLIARYKDKDFSLTDATSFVVMERRGITHAISYDDHFRQYGVILLG